MGRGLMKGKKIDDDKWEGAWAAVIIERQTISRTVGQRRKIARGGGLN